MLRKQQIEDGLDLTFSKVFVPYYARVVSTLAPSSILEVGGGTGHLALVLASRTKKYVVLEPSQGMFAVARDVLKGTIAELRQSTIEEFREEEAYDLVLSHMCVQVVSNLDKFLKAIAERLSPSGQFLLSLPHPVFYNDYKKFFPREKFRYIDEQNENISFSITLDPDQVIFDVPYHHRPLMAYISNLAGACLGVTYMDEVYPSEEVQNLYGAPWKDPRYLVLGGSKVANGRLTRLTRSTA